MVNIVTVGAQKYLVDVGFGAKEASQPVPLQDGYECPVLGPTQGRLALTHLDRHSAAAKSDQSQRLWVYSARPGGPDAPWQELYSFAETEYFSEDFEMMSHYVSTRPTSWFLHEVVAYRMVMDPSTGSLVGEIALHGANVTIRRVGHEDTVVACPREQDRVRALDTYFSIKLTEREQRAISGLVTALKHE